LELEKKFLNAECPETNMNHTSFFSSSVPSALSAVPKKKINSQTIYQLEK